MAEATFEQYAALTEHVMMGLYPILPQPDWGQDVAYLAFVLDGMASKLREIGEHLPRILDCAYSYNARIGLMGDSTIPEWIRNMVDPEVLIRLEEHPNQSDKRILVDNEQLRIENGQLRAALKGEGGQMGCVAFGECRVVIDALLKQMLTGVDTPENRRRRLMYAGASEEFADWFMLDQTGETPLTAPVERVDSQRKE